MSTQTPGLNSFTTPESIHREYTTLQSIILKICNAISLSYIFLISSAGAFAYQQNLRTPSVISEMTYQDISSAYALTTKLKEDLLTNIASSYSIPMSILRLPNVFGPPFMAGRPQGLVNKLILSSFNGDVVNINVSLHSKKNVLYIDDFCAAFLALLNLRSSSIVIPKLLLVASNHHISIGETIESINMCMNRFTNSKPNIKRTVPDSTQFTEYNPILDNSLLMSTLVDFTFTPFFTSIENSILELLAQPYTLDKQS